MTDTEPYIRSTDGARMIAIAPDVQQPRNFPSIINEILQRLFAVLDVALDVGSSRVPALSEAR